LYNYDESFLVVFFMQEDPELMEEETRLNFLEESKFYYRVLSILELNLRAFKGGEKIC